MRVEITDQIHETTYRLENMTATFGKIRAGCVIRVDGETVEDATAGEMLQRIMCPRNRFVPARN